MVNNGFEFTDEGRNMVDQYDEVVEMDELIDVYCEIYVQDLSRRLSINEDRLPVAYTFSTLLNPMFGLRPAILLAKLMTPMQYDNAREALLRAIQDDLDAKNPIVDMTTGSDDENSLDGFVHDDNNDNRRLAERELKKFESFKRQKYIPQLNSKRYLSGTDANGRRVEIGIGKVVSKGEDLPSGKNLVTYLDAKGRINLLAFFQDHQSFFPNLYTIHRREASRRVTEVGCERFFSSSGYVSQLRRSRLGVRNYERISMLSFALNNIYIDPDWVAEDT